MPVNEETAGEKATLRRRLRERRRALSPAWVAQNSRCVQQRAIELVDWADVAVFGSYLAMDGEVATSVVNAYGLEQGKTACVPAFCPQTGRYRMCRFEAASRVVDGPFRVPEPAEPAWMDEGQLDCLFVPGVAFDGHGGRLGHGAGHYDRILAAARPGATKVGLAFEFQVLQRVPRAAHDVPMDFVVTERRTRTRAGGAVERRGEKA